MKKKIKQEICEFRILMRSVPAILLIAFVLSVFSMNLLANKSISLPFDWLALDCGIIVSWFAFLTMDIITKHFGPKASTQISVMTIAINLILCLVFFCGSRIPGMWGEAYVEGSENLLNHALNRTFGGTWYVLAGSTLAFIISAIVNNLINWGIGRLVRKNPDGFSSYALRTYVSTAIGQFVDNMVFSLTVSHLFFGWTIWQCITCSLTGMVVELLCEVIFSFFGYRICEKWKKEKIGEAYLVYRNIQEENKN